MGSAAASSVGLMWPPTPKESLSCSRVSVCFFSRPQEEVGVPPAEENVGDDLLDRGVILGLRTGQKNVLVYDEAADGFDALRRKGLAA